MSRKLRPLPLGASYSGKLPEQEEIPAPHRNLLSCQETAFTEFNQRDWDYSWISDIHMSNLLQEVSFLFCRENAGVIKR